MVAAGVKICQYGCQSQASPLSGHILGSSSALESSFSFIMISLFKRMLAKLLALQKDLVSFVYSILWKYSSDRLTVIDHRTGRQYRMPISHNSIQALDFQAICTGRDSSPFSQTSGGLRVLDPGFRNTAVMKSQITFV